MADTSPNLDLPFLIPAQAQKHVTHNEALERLDLLVQLVVQGFEATTPPGTPAEGQIWALGAAPTGDWAGQGGRLAASVGGGWVFIAPRTGWRAWGQAEAQFRVWRGADWQLLPMDGLAGLGIGTAHDATNRLAVVSPAALFTHAGAGHQLKINKAAAGDTASLLYQTNWSGRAEMGLAGNDDFSLKVSANGTSWTEALRVNRTTGLLTGAAVTQSAADSTAGRLLKVGDFGLGGTSVPPYVADINNTSLSSGDYFTDANTLNIVGVGLSNFYGTLTVKRWSNNIIHQSWVDNASAAQRRFERLCNNGVWTSWQMLYSRNTILGPVLQVGGIPTGAIIERGSNANGDYVRFADGTQICTSPQWVLDTNVPSGSLFRSAEQIWVFPAAFSAVPMVHATNMNNTEIWGAARSSSTTGAAGRLWAATSFTGRSLRMSAIGRWF